MIPNRRTKRRSKNVDSRLKISGMTREETSFLSGSIAFFRHPSPLNDSTRSPNYKGDKSPL